MNFCKRFRYLLLLIILVLSIQGHSQKLSTFSGDSTQFINELWQLFSILSKDDQKIVKDEMDRFSEKWTNEAFPHTKKVFVYQTANKMLKKRLRSFPDFYNFVRALNIFEDTKQSDKTFFGWSEILLRLIDEKNTRNFLSFLQSSSDLFSDSLVYRSSSTAWKLSRPEYTFFFDSVPEIDFGQSDLYCFSSRDTLIIYQTRGRYYPLTFDWIGTGGKVDWKRCGMEQDQVYATLSDYIIQMKFARYSADSVQFYNKKYFSSYMPGVLTDKVQADVSEERGSYPRFSSYANYIGIIDIFKDIDYMGGFSMEGARVIGFGVKGRDAQLTFKKEGKVFLKARSQTFIIRPDRINSGNAEIVIHHDEDSIYHPGLLMKYMNETKELLLNKDERVTVFSPWFDTWHNVEIYCEALYWKLNEPKINFEAMRGPQRESKAIIESSDYYTLDRYQKLQGMDEINPLNVIYNYSKKSNSREFTLNQLIGYWKKPREQVGSQLFLLSTRGFLIYDVDDQKVVIKDKLIDYVNAKNGKIDYDVIFFSSTVTGESNAILDLSTFDMKIRGVQSVFLCDSQQVYIYPEKQELVMKKNRDFTFSGKVEAGLLDFYADSCSFEYDKFKINMPAIDTLEFYVKSRTRDPKTGTYPFVKVQTALNDLTGYLMIDAPDNKAGLKSLSEYPIFTSRDTSYANWDKSYIYNHVYRKNEFFFQVQPFVLKSLDYIDTDSLRFNGRLISAGIFPDIEQPLKVRPDYSLGFEKMTEISGLPLYGGKGVFVSNIDLSNKGLRGNGRVTYLNSTSVSNNFLFFPDSMKTITDSFLIQEQIAGVEYPDVVADTVREFWLPYQDSMVITTLKKELAMFHNQSGFEGTLGMTPSGVTGSGTVKIMDAEMDSEGFSFLQHTFDALIADFRIKSYDLSELAISTKNYRTHFDFEQRIGEFKSNVGMSRMEFPVNKYICSMDQFNWMIDHEEITLSNEGNQKYSIPDNLSLAQLIDIGYTGSEFISVHPLQDSLRFFALNARYNLKTNVINALDVKIIKVADAAIYPDSGLVEIHRNAEMKVLENANIIANTQSRIHNFYNASVSIASRKNYTAHADYDYVDCMGDRQKIHFSKIRVDSMGMTTAMGSIGDSAGFKLSPQFDFSGGMTLYAPEKNLAFTGSFRPVTDCFDDFPDWVKFSSAVDPQHVVLPMVEPTQNRRSEKLTIGILFSNTKNHIYPAFFIPKHSFSDTTMIAATGEITYDPASAQFRIGNPDKFEDPYLPGSSLALHTTNCQIHADGPINLSMNAGPLQMKTYGTLDYFAIPDSTVLRIAVSLDFPFLRDVMLKIREHLDATNLPWIQLFQSPYHTLMANSLNERVLKELKMDAELVGNFRKYPIELSRTLILADVRMSYDSVRKSYISVGQIGVGSILDDLVNRYMTGQVEFTKKRNGDEFTIYLEIPGDEWYFFNYRNNVMQFLSSDTELNDLIKEAQLNNSELRRLNSLWKGYRYTLSTLRKKRDFLQRTEPRNEEEPGTDE